MDVVEELLVGPRAILEDEEYIVGIGAFGMILEHVVHEGFSFLPSLRNKLQGLWPFGQRGTY